jgi:uncharacterized RDD family membrane protein YckC
MRWYYADGKRKVGPFTEIEIDQFALEGTINPETLVWNEKTLKWKPYKTLKDNDIVVEPLQEESPDTVSDTPKRISPVDQLDTQVESLCDECGRSFPVDEMVRYGESMICATCKPLFFQKLKQGSLALTVHYAGFWIRLVAKIIDGIIVGMVNMVFSLIASFAIAMIFMSSNTEQVTFHPGIIGLNLLVGLLQVVTAAAYDTYFIGKYAATLGKMACGIKIITADGGKVTYLRAFARHFAEWLSKLTLFIGYIMAGFDREKRALHDHICNTRVIKK